MGKITHLTGARYHHVTSPTICASQRRQIPSRAKFQHQSTEILYLDINHPQTNHFWPSWQGIRKKFGNIKAHGLFCVFHHVEVSSPQEPHTDLRPFVFAYSLSLFFNLPITATVPSCHPSSLCLRSTLLSIRIITKPFYQIFHTHLGPVHIFLGLVLRPLFFFRSVKLLFSFAFATTYVFFWPPENHASRDDSR